jgi:hypothetical protein
MLPRVFSQFGSVRRPAAERARIARECQRLLQAYQELEAEQAFITASRVTLPGQNVQFVVSDRELAEIQFAIELSKVTAVTMEEASRTTAWQELLHYGFTAPLFYLPFKALSIQYLYKDMPAEVGAVIGGIALVAAIATGRAQAKPRRPRRHRNNVSCFARALNLRVSRHSRPQAFEQQKRFTQRSNEDDLSFTSALAIYRGQPEAQSGGRTYNGALLHFARGIHVLDCSRFHYPLRHLRYRRSSSHFCAKAA